MALTYTPVNKTGKHAGEIFAEVVEAANTTAKDLIQFYDNVKDEVYLTSMTGKANFRRYKEDIRETDFARYTDTLAAADQKLQPSKMTSIVFFKMDDLKGTRFGGTKPGAGNIDSPEFETAVKKYLTPLFAKGFEEQIWSGITIEGKAAIAASNLATVNEKAWAAAQNPTEDDIVDGLIVKMILKRTLTVSASGIITTSNIKTSYESVLSAAPSAAVGNSAFTLFAPHSHKLMIDMFNINQTYRDLFKVNGDTYTFLNKPIEFVPVPEDTIVGGLNKEFGAATDLLSDSVAFEINKVNNVGDQKFGKLTCSLDTGIVVPTQKVLLK